MPSVPLVAPLSQRSFRKRSLLYCRRVSRRSSARKSPPGGSVVRPTRSSGIRAALPRRPLPVAGDVHPNAVQPGPGGHVQRAPIRVAPRHVGRDQVRLDGAEVPPVRRDDPDPAGTGRPQVALLVDLQAVGRAALPRSRWRRAAARPRRGRRPRPPGNAIHCCGAAVGHVQERFVGREGDAVRAGLLGEAGELAVRAQPVDRRSRPAPAPPGSAARRAGR